MPHKFHATDVGVASQRAGADGRFCSCAWRRPDDRSETALDALPTPVTQVAACLTRLPGESIYDL